MRIKEAYDKLEEINEENSDILKGMKILADDRVSQNIV